MSDVVVVADRLPWEMQPSESVAAFQAFACYRDMVEGRSITKVALELDKSRTLIARWSSEHNWQRRIEAWELHQDRRMLEARESERQRIDREQRLEGRYLRVSAITRFTGGTDQHGNLIEPIDWNDLDADRVLAAYRLGVKTERQAAGLQVGAALGMIPLAQARRIVEEVFEIALDFIDENRRQTFIQRVHSLAENGQ